MKTICLKSVDSTNTYIKNLPVKERVDGLIVVADKQTAGRGRMGKTFKSDGKGIYMSFVIKTDCAVSEAVVLTSFAAVSVCRAIEKVCGINAGIKWVNDIVYGGRKLCGILTEAVNVSGDKAECFIIGIGVNVNEEKFTDDLKDKAVSLKMILNRNVDKEKLLLALKEELNEMKVSCFNDKENFYNEYIKRSVMFGKTVVLNCDDIPAEVIGIDKNYALAVKYGNGEIKKVNSGDISVDGIYGLGL